MRVEARIKFSPSAGLWGAPWHMANATSSANLELDVQEFRGAVPTQASCHVHIQSEWV